MRDIEAAIHAKVELIAANNNLFKFLSDESMSATERLSRLAPCLAYFALGFHDLQLLVLKYPAAEAKVDRVKKAINAHCNEDSTHWPWFLTDLKTLGLDKEMSFTGAIKYLWGKETQKQRSTCYQLAILADRARDPFLRFVFLQSLEILGRAWLTKFLDLADKSEIETGKEILYFGRTHFARETGGLHGEEEIESELLETELSPDMKIKALEIAMKVLEIQDAQLNELGRVGYANRKW